MVRKKKKITKAILKKREKRALKREFKSKLEKWKIICINRDKSRCQMCNRDLLNERKNVHHIIALQAVKRKYPILLEDTMNGILLCSFCHKYAPDSPHQGSFEFVLFLERTRPEQYNYLKIYLTENAEQSIQN